MEIKSAKPQAGAVYCGNGSPRRKRNTSVCEPFVGPRLGSLLAPWPLPASARLSVSKHQKVKRTPKELAANVDKLIRVETAFSSALQVVRNGVNDSFGDS